MPPDIGDVFRQRYRIDAKLGGGGQGVVFKAHDEQLDRAVAIKFPTGNFYAGEAFARFIREARFKGRLHHSGICQVYDFEAQGGAPFIVMEFVDGVTLRDLIAGHAPNRLDPVRICVQIARALERAHAAGIVHRDIKPENILVTATGRAVLIDFGLGKALGPVTQLTQDGQSLGTLGYMAPEQRRGAAVDARADVFALGLVLYESITRKAALSATSSGGVPMSPTLERRRVLAAARPSLFDIIQKAVEEEPFERYAGARDFAEDLDRYAAREPVRARPVGRARRILRWSRSNPREAGLAAALVAVAVLAFVVILDLLGSKETARLDAVYDRYVSSIALADQRIQSGQVAEALTELNRCPIELRDLEWDLLYAQAKGESEIVRRSEWPLACLTGGSELRAACTAGGVYARGQAPLREPDERDYAAIALDHSGTRLAVVLDNDNQRRLLLHSPTDDPIRDYPLPDTHRYCLAFHPREPVLLAGSSSGDLLMSRCDQLPRPVRRLASQAISHIAFAPDGRSVALACLVSQQQLGRVIVLSWPEMAEMATISLDTNYPTALAYSPDGQRLLIASRDQVDPTQGRVALHDAHNGRLLGQRPRLGFRVDAVAVSADHRRVALGCADGAVRLLDASMQTSLGTHLGHEATVRALRFASPAELHSVSNDGTWRRWDPRQASRRIDIDGPTYAVRSIAIASGKRVVLGDPSRTLEATALRNTLADQHHATGRHSFVTLLDDDAVIAWDQQCPKMRQIDLATGHERELPASAATNGATALAIDPDRRVAYAAHAEGVLRIPLDQAPGQREFLESSQDVQALRLSRHGDTLVGRRHDSCRIWNARTRRLLGTIDGPVDAVAVNSTGDEVAVGTEPRQVRVYRVTPDGCVETNRFEVQAQVLAMAFSPTGSRLTIATGNPMVSIWDPVGGHCLLALAVSSEVTSLRFSEPGDLLVAGSANGGAIVWATSREISRPLATRRDWDDRSTADIPEALVARLERVPSAIRHSVDVAQVLDEVCAPRWWYEFAHDAAAYSQNHGDPEVRWRADKGAALFRLGEHDEAELELERAMRHELEVMRRRQPSTIFFRAMNLAALGRSKEATAVLESGPESSSELYRQAKVLVEREHGVDAYLWLRRRYPNGWMSKGVPESCPPSLRAAVAELDAARTIDPGRQNYLAWLVVRFRGRPPEMYAAAAEWTQCANEQQPDPLHQLVHAYALYRLGEHDGACQTIADHTWPEGLRPIASILSCWLRLERDPVAARSAYNEAIVGCHTEPLRRSPEVQRLAAELEERFKNQ
ncbi:MAG: WD40 repeat domain-containing serine/threonine-protein kinase [Planctomycetota bacterium]